MRRTLLLTTLAFALAFAGACNQTEPAALAGNDTREETSAVATKDLSPEELGKLGAEIKKNPDRAEQLLSERGLDAQTFEAEIRKVSEDPEASKRYAAAYKEASAA